MVGGVFLSRPVLPRGCRRPELPPVECRRVVLSTRHPFDEMGKKAAGTGEDPFRLLPDDQLDHILSLLPGDDALQTCLLDTQWRYFWRRNPCTAYLQTGFGMVP
ncbi:putative F-box/FBD/LRR-repeat protein At1g66300 [Aegilops tauschii subsp. strangulata]|uniref:putative F-box/FBD/LRR-repeat protein At1g66300 n=1 Tax=Aegilops tauschii subsp. strangulata TaxID=200361 RepID=UPI003CC8A975